MKNVCDICGGRIINKNGRWVCQSCGHLVPEEITNEEIDLLYHASQQLRLCNFDDAEILFRDVTSQYPNNANAFWGLCLSEYGIKYEKDYDSQMIPTCYKTSYKSLYDNENFKQAYNLSEDKEKIYLREQAEKIEKIRMEWVNAAAKEEPYDIFLSYKATELNNDNLRTDDSYEAHELYNELTKMGYKVFFSKEALASKTGEHYEPYIFNALNTCDVMIIYSSKPEYVNSVWVKNEWTRYLKRIGQKQKLNNSLLLIYKDFNPAELPRPLSNIQNLNRNDIRFGEKLDNYLNRVISEVKKNIPKIESIYLKPFEIKNKKLNKIKKRELNGVVPKNVSISVNIETRAFGNCSSSNLTPDIDSRLKIGYGFLDKNLYEDALKRFEDVLYLDKTNGIAILGKLLSLCRCKNFKTFLDTDFSKFTYFSLLQDSISYLEKEKGEKLLSSLYDKVIKCINCRNRQSALNLYLQICDYNVDAIQQRHAFLIQEVMKTNDLNDVSIQLVKFSLKFLMKDEKIYQDNILFIVNSLIQLGKFEIAKEIYNDADKFIFDNLDFIKLLFFIESHKKTFDEAIVEVINTNDIDFLAMIVESLSISNANAILNEFSDVIAINFGLIKPIKLTIYSEFLTYYDFDNYDKFVNEIIKKIITSHNESYNDLFEHLIKTFDEKDSDKAIAYMYQYSVSFNEKSDFLFAKKYIDMALSYQQNNVKLLKYKLLISLGCKDEDDLYKDIYKLNDFTTLERLLISFRNKADMIYELQKISDACSKYVSANYKNINSKIFDVFDRLIRYFPEDALNELIDALERMANRCISYGYFEIADKYFSMITGLDSTEYKAYWGLLQAKLKCKNNNELIRQSVDISGLPEFNNALFLASKNSDVYEEYIECKAKQTEFLKKVERKKRLKKKMIVWSSIFISLFTLIAVVSTLTIYIFIPNVKYNEAINLVNEGRYNEAYNKFDDLKYKDYKNQLLVCKAGEAFSNGDYENGIKNIYEAGGVVTVSYDSVGGELDKTTETITKKSNFINTTPLLAGYKFYGWIIHDFDLNTSHKKYECSLELKATYKLVNYTLTYELNGGEIPSLPKTYNCESEDILLPNPVKKGYEFIGWESNYFESSVKNLVIEKGSYGNKHFVANFKANKYNITYDYDYDGKVSEGVATYDSHIELDTPSREGYEFQGWLNNGEKIENGKREIDHDITLKAKWNLIEYDIKYDLNGGQNDPSNLNTYTIETPAFELSQPTKPGYDFIGWTGTDLDEPSIDVLITNGSIGNRNYIANWVPHSYKITFNTEGGELEVNSMDVLFNDDFLLPKPTKTGYTFSGWYNSYDDSLVSDGKWNYLADLSLYAKWNVNSYNVFYELDGGVNHEDNPSSFTFETEDITIQNPTKDGYTFIGWSSELGDEQIMPSIKKGTNNNLTFKAKRKPNLNTIAFEGNGNTSGQMPSVLKYTDETFKLPKNQFVRLGYHFLGWACLPTGNPQYQDEDEIKTNSSSVTYLYAVREANTNTITYHGNGSDEGNMPNQTAKTDSEINLSTNQFRKKGYHFVGWSSMPNGKIDYTENDLYLMGANNNYDLYAIWEPNEYKISLDSNGGEINSEFKKVIYDKDFDLPIPERKGYLFSGWYLGDSQITDAVGSSLANYVFPGDITVTAIWTPKLNTLILKDSNDEKTLQANSDTLIRLPKDVFLKETHSLIGWAEYEGGPITYYNDDLFYVGTNDRYELYAIWEEKNDNKFEGYNTISTKEDFLNLLQDEKNDHKKYYLTNDIDLEGVTIAPTVDFGGDIDGNGFAIKNFNLCLSDYEYARRSVNRMLEEITYSYYTGFFKTNYGTIKNLQLDSFYYVLDLENIEAPEMSRSTEKYCDKYSKLFIGSFSGKGFGTFENCKVISQTQEIKVTLGGAYYIGLITGYNDSQIGHDPFIDCFSCNKLSFKGVLNSAAYNNRNTTNTFNVGGIVGYKKEGDIKKCSVINDGIVDVVTNEMMNGDYKPSNKTFIGDYSGNKLNEINCTKFDSLEKYNNYVRFNYDNSNSYQFVEGHSRFTLNKNLYKKDGHNFIGWSLTPNGEIVYKDMDECFIPYGENKITLYPVFVKK